MSTFSSILSSIGGQQTSQASSNNQPGQRSQAAHHLASSSSLTPRNTAAGVKRTSEEAENAPTRKTAKTEPHGGVPKSAIAAAPANRFQLSAKAGTAQRPTTVQHRSTSSAGTASSPHKVISKPIVPKNAGKAPTPQPSSAHGAAPQKRGFASIMEKAKAQVAVQPVGPSGIKHKTAVKMTKRERRKAVEEAEAQSRAAKRGKRPQDARNDGRLAGSPKKGLDGNTNYKGTMKIAAEPLSYRGTMHTGGAGDKQKKKSGVAQDKYGGYASWSDLDDAEDEEDDDDSEASSDMEGGFDAVEQEEMSALRSARREDQEALEEEERNRRAKLDRKRKLEALSKSAAARKKY